MILRIELLWMLMSLFIRVLSGKKHLFIDQSAIKDVQVDCNSDSILITMLASSEFNGLIYPKGLARNSTCMTEYVDETGEIKYFMPLNSCNTMSTDVIDGVEYHNTIVVQPHRHLVTDQGKGYHIRCRYQTKDQISLSNPTVNISDVLFDHHDIDNVVIPSSTMKIYIGEDDKHLLQAENVKIGDSLRMVISIDTQSIYGMKVSNCLVHDGLNWGEQQLINSGGCSVDHELMEELEYSADKTMATVRFQAHKFPYTSSIYYQCNVKLCLKKTEDCDEVPPLCTSDGRNLRRKKRQSDTDPEVDGESTTQEPKDKSVAVFTGLHVNDPEEESIGEPEPAADSADKKNVFCISVKLFAIIIAVIGLILMLAVILLVICLIQRRRRRRDIDTNAGSSVYSGPYSNMAYSSM